MSKRTEARTPGAQGSPDTSRRPELPKAERSASFQVTMAKDQIGWLNSSLMHLPEVPLYDDGFLEPFDELTIKAARVDNQLMFQAALKLGPTFNEEFGEGIGRMDQLTPLLRKYPEPFHNLSEDRTQFFTTKKDGEVTGAIVRVSPDTIIVQTGMQAGPIEVSPTAPVNTVGVELGRFNFLLQRYVSALWKSSDAYSQNLSLQLTLPQLPEGAVATHFSTAELVMPEFRTHPRPIDINKDIGGYEGPKQAITGLFMDLADPDTSRSFGTKPHSDKFHLITGRKDTGKTLFLKALHGMMEVYYGKQGRDFDHIRVPLEDILNKYRNLVPQIMATILGEVRQNERDGKPTLLHLDGLGALMSPLEKQARVVAREDSVMFVPPTEAEFALEMNILAPVRTMIRDLGKELGVNSQHVIVVGESRASRDELPEALLKTFRRSTHLEPVASDLQGIFEVQIANTRLFAKSSGVDPISAEVDMAIPNLAQLAEGFTGGDIQTVLVNIATANKASWDGTEASRRLITPDSIRAEILKLKQRKNGGIQPVRRPLGYPTPSGRN